MKIRAPTERVIGQLVRYGAIAGSGYLLAIGLYSLELKIGIAPYLGLGVAFILNGLYNFALMRRWVFPPSGRRVHIDLSRFCAVATSSFVVNYASFAALYSGLGVGAETSQRLGALIAAPVTFLANRVWGFRAEAEVSDDQEAAEPAVATSAKNASYSRL